MKKIIILLIPFLLCGCSNDMNRKEIDEVSLIHVIGIDYSKNEFTISAVYSSGGGADPQQKSTAGTEQVAEGKGKTAYEAFEDLKLKNKRTVSITNTGFFLIGEEAAKYGIYDSLDFLSRDETVKMESLVFVTQGVKAADFIKQGIKDKQTVHDDMKAISQKQLEMIKREDNTLVNILNEMKQSYSSVIIPYLISKEKSFQIEGYAVFDKQKLLDYLDNETSNGINFVKNIIRRYPIYINDKVGLLLSFSNTKLKAALTDKGIIVTIRVNFETMIKEVTTTEDIFSQEALLKLTEEQNQYIKKIIEKAVNYSTSYGLDILQLARLVENQHVKEWKNIESTWSSDIYNIKYEYVFNSKIAKSFILGNER